MSAGVAAARACYRQPMSRERAGGSGIADLLVSRDPLYRPPAHDEDEPPEEFEDAPISPNELALLLVEAVQEGFSLREGRTWRRSLVLHVASYFASAAASALFRPRVATACLRHRSRLQPCGVIHLEAHTACGGE